MTLLLDQRPDDPHHVSSQTAQGLVMTFTLGAFAFIKGSRGGRAVHMPGQGHHHRRFGPRVHLSRCAGAGLLARAVIERSHAHVEREARLVLKARQAADLSGKLGAANCTKPGDAVHGLRQLGALGPFTNLCAQRLDVSLQRTR